MPSGNQFAAAKGFSRIALQIPDGLSKQVISTAVARDGDTVTSMSGVADLWPQVVEHFLPEGIELDGGSIVSLGGEFLRPAGDEMRIRLFANLPRC